MLISENTLGTWVDMTQQKATPEFFLAKSLIVKQQLSQLVHPLKNSIAHLLVISDFASRSIPLLLSLLEKDECNALLSRKAYFDAVAQLNLGQSMPLYSAQVRRFRNTHLLRILLLESAGIASTEDSMRSWSDCADALILHALAYCQKQVSERYGIPRDEALNPVHLFTLAMGKLGGMELNYSSDIDLIFTFSHAGHTDGCESISNQEYFTKVVQQFIQVMQTLTADGFVFRVDLRLRPNGDSGALVSSLAAIETYYQEQGRDWERYAMVKARVIEPQVTDVPAWFSQLITPFVYRRYVDFSVIESLRSMKAMIEREVALNPRLDDIKRGQGGIREVEFIIQNMQLIRGGRLPQLRHQNAMLALSELKKEQLVPRAAALKQAYLYLRRLENALQSHNDQQTHALPEDPIKQMQMALSMGHTNWDELLTKLHQYQRIISSSFRATLGNAHDDYDDAERLLAYQLSSLWQGHVETDMAINLLTALGFEGALHCYQMIHSFRHGSRCRRLPQAARMRLDRFMVVLLKELMHRPHTETVLLQVIQLLEQTVGRSAYLALLTENPQALKELLFWFSNSAYITDLLVKHPFLLEVLLEQAGDWRPESRAQLELKLKKLLKHCSDKEAKEEVLRQFKLIHWLMAARAEHYGQCTAVRIAAFLSDIAQVIVSQVLELAYDELSLRYPEIQQIKQRFAIIAYGKLGSREMSYTSDLDLVFLYSADPSEEPLVTRLTQKIVHMLTTRLQTGVLFYVDTRLRPSGSAGLLVSHLDSFVQYQKNQAWTWEHQALIKARVLSGSAQIKRQFLELKEVIICFARDKKALQDDVLLMRAKINQQTHIDAIKHAPGGLLDLEFMLQYLILQHGCPQLARMTRPLNQMRQLLLLELITKDDFILFKKAYECYHKLLHEQIINPREINVLPMQKEVLRLSNKVFH